MKSNGGSGLQIYTGDAFSPDRGLLESGCLSSQATDPQSKDLVFERAATFDHLERFIAYGGGMDQGEYLPDPCRKIYDEEGRLIAILGELREEDKEEGWGWWDESIDYSGQIGIQYRDDGTVSNMEYIRSPNRYRTFDSSGDIEYDEKGRMLSNEYYITHGRDIDIYLYEEDRDMPWCLIRWCCFVLGFEDIYLFLSQEP